MTHPLCICQIDSRSGWKDDPYPDGTTVNDTLSRLYTLTYIAKSLALTHHMPEAPLKIVPAKYVPRHCHDSPSAQNHQGSTALDFSFLIFVYKCKPGFLRTES